MTSSALQPAAVEAGAEAAQPGPSFTSITPPRMPMVAAGVRIVTALSCLLSLPPTKRNTPRVRLATSLPVPEFGL